MIQSQQWRKWETNISLYKGTLSIEAPPSLSEMTFLTGENGSGKSSFINYLNYNLSTLNPHLCYGLAPQVRLQTLGQRRGSDLIKLLEKRFSYFNFFDFFGIKELLNVPINSLSGGENQKLKLTIALGLARDFFIADEPTNDLDARGLEILDLLLQERIRNKKGALLVLHRLDWYSGKSYNRWHLQGEGCLKLSMTRQGESQHG